MMVAFLLRGVCPECGCGIRGVSLRRVRVNKRSLRTIGSGLAGMGSCPECGQRVRPDQYDHILDPADAAKVAAKRAAMNSRRAA